MTEVLDSYTGEPYVEDYTSPIPDIRRGRESFWRRAEREKAAEQYWVSPVGGAALTQGPGETDSPATPLGDPRFEIPPPSGWLLRRKDSPSDLFPVMQSQPQAVAVMDWCVRNDASIRIVLHWLERGNPTPFLCMLQDIVRIAQDAKGD
jgi:hypothetical protein